MKRVKLLMGILTGGLVSTVVFANIVSTENNMINSNNEGYQINKNGETYGPNKPGLDYEPDLMAAIGVNGVEGYVRAKDLDSPDFKTPEEAIAWQNSKPDVIEIPVYDQEGEKIIDTFKIK